MKDAADGGNVVELGAADGMAAARADEPFRRRQHAGRRGSEVDPRTRVECKSPAGAKVRLTDGSAGRPRDAADAIEMPNAPPKNCAATYPHASRPVILPSRKNV